MSVVWLETLRVVGSVLPLLEQAMASLADIDERELLAALPECVISRRDHIEALSVLSKVERVLGEAINQLESSNGAQSAKRFASPSSFQT